MNTGTFNVFLTMLAAQVEPDGPVVLMMDRAGWQRIKAVKLPECVTVPLLPPYSPVLNPWHHLRSHYLSNRACYAYVIDAGTAAWRRLTPDVIKSVCRYPYLECAGQVRSA